MTSLSVSTEQVQDALAKMMRECMKSVLTHREYLDDFNRISFALEILQDIGLITSEQNKKFIYEFNYLYLKAGESS